MKQLLACLLFLVGTPVSGQGILPAGPASAAVDSLVALAAARRLALEGDTAVAVQVLKSAVESAPRNAVLWHAYGTLLYAWTRPHWRRMPMPPGIPQRIIAAESSLARAMWLAPDSAQYAIDYARNLFATNTTSLSAAQRAEHAALERADRMGDPALMANSAEHLGLLLWRRFEVTVDSGMLENPGVIVSAARPGELERTVRRKYVPRSPPAGIGLYNEALEYFRFARRVAHDDERAFRREVMALSFMQRWNEMRTTALERIAVRPAQPWPWLALGLAEHRLSRIAAATVAFDSGFARLPGDERERLLFLPRLLRQGYERWFDTLPDDLRNRIEHVYWLNADPSLLLPGNPVRSEFLARVVNAEVSWTDDEKPLKGAQSPKGEIHIRYGPADYIANHRWYYYTPIDTFFEFRQTWGYGTAAHTIASLILADSLRRHHGSMFFNVPLVRRGVDTIRAQVARFRGAPDSIALFVVAELPVGSLRRHLATEESQMRSGLFTFDGDGTQLTDERGTVTARGGDSTRTTLQLQRTSTRANATLARIELLETDTERIARGIFDISGFGTTGFGISDIILSTRITAPRNADRARWQEFVVQPALGATFVQGTPIDLLWETYGRQSIDGTSRHRVAVSVQRVEQRGFIAVGARMIGSVRGAVTGTPGADRLAVVFERSTAHQPELAEYLRLGLQDTRPGRYRLSVRVTDLQSGAAAERVREFVVVARR